MFEDLKGIEKGREERGSDIGHLDYLLETCDKLVRKNQNAGLEWDKVPAVYAGMYQHLREEAPDFNENDLINFVYARSNYEDEIHQKKILGLYSGCLLHLLTERNNAKEKETRIYINGRRNTFDYLFYNAEQIDELLLENFKGDHICELAGNHGKINLLGLAGIQGRLTLEQAARGGKAGIIICRKMGDPSCTNDQSYAMYAVAKDSGEADLVIGTQILGNYALCGIAESGGRINLAIAKDIQGDSALRLAAQANGTIVVLATQNIKGRKPFDKMCDYHGTVMVHIGENIPEIEDFCYDLYKLPKTSRPEAERKQKLQDFKINEITALVESMEGKTPEEQFAITDEIKELYESTRGKIYV